MMFVHLIPFVVRCDFGRSQSIVICEHMVLNPRRASAHFKSYVSGQPQIDRAHSVSKVECDDIPHLHTLPFQNITHTHTDFRIVFKCLLPPTLAQSIPQFLPVMRGSHHSLPATRDPEVLERLQPGHLNNMCQRMQSHLHLCAAKVSAEQNALSVRMRDVDADAAKVLALSLEKQKLYASYAEHFAKVRQVTQQLSRCTSLVQQNLAAVVELNAKLPAELRLEPFVWMIDETTTTIATERPPDDDSGGGGVVGVS